MSSLLVKILLFRKIIFKIQTMSEQLKRVNINLEPHEVNYPLTEEAKALQEAELAGLGAKTSEEIGAFWERYDNLAEEIVSRGLTEDRLQEIGGNLREGVSMRDVGAAISDMGAGSYERMIAYMNKELQRVISFP